MASVGEPPHSKPADTGTPRRQRVRIRVTMALGLALLLAVVVSMARAQGEITTPYTYTFGQIASFSLAAPAETGVAEATLFLSVNEERTQAYMVPLQDGQGQYERDLRKEPFPPFAQITYWWKFEDAQGESQETGKTRFSYADNRFRWQTLQAGTVTLHWVSGEPALMVNALDIAQASLAEIQNALKVSDVGQVAVYIYPSMPDLQTAMRLSGGSWVGGQAYPELGVVLVTIPPTDDAIVKMKRDIPHELTHKVLYDLVADQGYASQPIWLVEGLASHFEQSPDPTYTLALKQARENGTLIPLETLCYPFPAEQDRAILAYAQSQSFLAYLQQTYGWSRIRALIDAYADGLGCSAGMEQALGVSLATVERDWRVWLEQASRPENASQRIWSAATFVVRDLAPWLVLVATMALSGGLFLVGARPARQKP